MERGRRRLRSGLGWLAVVAAAVAIASFWVGRVVPALLASGAAALVLYARRVSADLDPIYLEIDGERLFIQMRRWREEVPLQGARPRRLTAEEIEHLTRLATTARVTAGTGGFDSHLLGELELYASDLRHAVLVELDERAVVVTPDDPDAFLVAVAAGTVASRDRE